MYILPKPPNWQEYPWAILWTRPVNNNQTNERGEIRWSVVEGDAGKHGKARRLPTQFTRVVAECIKHQLTRAPKKTCCLFLLHQAGECLSLRDDSLLRSVSLAICMFFVSLLVLNTFSSGVFSVPALTNWEIDSAILPSLWSSVYYWQCHLEPLIDSSPSEY